MATSNEDLEETEQKFNAASKHLPSILSNVASQDLVSVKLMLVDFY